MAKKRGNIKSKKTKFSNKLFYTLIITGIIVLAAIGIYATILTLIDIGHSQEEIIVSINGCDVILKDAISGEWLKDLSTSTLSGSDCLSESEFPKKYHLASEIIVTINSYTLTLQDAINQNYFKGTGTISSSSSVPSRGHLATEVEVTVNSKKKTLQNALSELKNICVANYNQNCPSGDAACTITTGTIACDGTCEGALYKISGTSCGTNMQCDGSGNCVSTCVPNVGNDCDDGNICTYDETIQCDGSCGGGSPVSKGTDCEGDSKACDGFGNCSGWSGTGCTACPWSYYDVGWHICYLEGNQGRSQRFGTWFPWTYTEDNAAVCSVNERYCCSFWIICWKHCWRSIGTAWLIKP